jgi:hypothetical protein
MSLKKLSSNKPSRAIQRALVPALLHETGPTICCIISQPVGSHSVRSSLTAVVRKKLGLMLVSRRSAKSVSIASRTMSHRNARQVGHRAA